MSMRVTDLGLLLRVAILEAIVENSRFITINYSNLNNLLVIGLVINLHCGTLNIYAEVDMPAWLRHMLLAARMALPSGVILADRLEKIYPVLINLVIRRSREAGRLYNI